MEKKSHARHALPRLPILDMSRRHMTRMDNSAVTCNDQLCHLKYGQLVYITQVNSTFRARWLASSEVISQILFTSEQPKKSKMAFVGYCHK